MGLHRYSNLPEGRPRESSDSSCTSPAFGSKTRPRPGRFRPSVDTRCSRIRRRARLPACPKDSMIWVLRLCQWPITGQCSLCRSFARKGPPALTQASLHRRSRSNRGQGGKITCAQVICNPAKTTPKGHIRRWGIDRQHRVRGSLTHSRSVEKWKAKVLATFPRPD